MSLDIIYTSRLYRSSKLKDKITSTIDNPINTELVKQLESYIDETSLDTAENTLVELHDDDQSPEVNEDAANETVEDFETTDPHNENIFVDDDASDDTPTEDRTDDSDDVADDEDSDDDSLENVPGVILEGQELAGDYVEAATALYSTPKRAEFDGDVNVIKGTLNLREETSGVVRVSLDKNELWVYYNDDTNLNAVMVDVIDVIERAGYNFLKFNRLARSNNAIVFDVAKASTEVTEGGE